MRLLLAANNQATRRNEIIKSYLQLGSSSNRYAPRLPQQETKSSTKQLPPTGPILGPENILKTGFAQKGLPSDPKAILADNGSDPTELMISTADPPSKLEPQPMDVVSPPAVSQHPARSLTSTSSLLQKTQAMAYRFSWIFVQGVPDHFPKQFCSKGDQFYHLTFC